MSVSASSAVWWSMDDYLEFGRTLWSYLPLLQYAMYVFVFATLLPQSLRRIRSSADVDYAAQRRLYHRCYGPERCCHVEAGDGTGGQPRPRQRKPVTRVYPKRQSSAESAAAAAATAIKRQVPASSIQTRTHVNQIARMFESGGVTTRVAPAALAAVTAANRRINAITDLCAADAHANAHESYLNFDKEASSGKALTQLLLQENIENSANLLNQADAPPAEGHSGSDAASVSSSCWRNEQLLAPLQRRTRHVPTTLTYAGTSATPSTASPAASSSGSPRASPVRRSPPSLHLKSSLEDIYAAIARSAEEKSECSGGFAFGCRTLSPVTSIDDILAQRRLSRPLSAYSISDLLMNEEDAAAVESVESFLRTLNNT